jgi:glycosyltransferase involved in cell wall biosynthesis
VHGELTLLEGEFEGTPAPAPLPAESFVVFAGRHIPEKNPVAVVHAVAKARETIPDLTAKIYGDGPERPKVLAAIAERGLEGVVAAPGFVEEDILESALARALCLVLPSRREGYGLVVLEALSRGTPAIVVAGRDNAATEFIDDGVNGFVVEDAGEAIGQAITRAERAGDTLRQSTLDWFRANAQRLSLETSLGVVEDAYRA